MVGTASLVLRSETEGVCPNTDAALDAHRAGWQSNWRTGTVMRDAVNAVPRRVYGLRWRGAEYGQMYEIRDKWLQSGGGALLMDYTPIGEVDADKVVVSFVPGTLQMTQRGLDLFDISVDIEERL